MLTPDISSINGVKMMTPLEMNKVHFDKKHTVLTPELLASLGVKGAPKCSQSKT